MSRCKKMLSHAILWEKTHPLKALGSVAHFLRNSIFILINDICKHLVCCPHRSPGQNNTIREYAYTQWVLAAALRLPAWESVLTQKLSREESRASFSPHFTVL